MGIFFRDGAQPVTASASPVSGVGRRAKPAAYNTQRAITASAKRLGKSELDSLGGKAQPYREWQRDAWVGYDRIGEIHYGFNLVANVFSRVRVYGAAIVDVDEAPVTLSQAREDGRINSELARAVEELMTQLVRTDFSSQTRAFSLNMSVPGECLLVQLPNADSAAAVDASEGQWVIRSTDEIKVEADKIRLVPRSDLTGAQDRAYILSERKSGKWTPELNIGRIWRQHPRYTEEPDSSMRAISDSIEELLLVSRLTRNATRSRLNAGMLFVPDGVSAVGGSSALEEAAVDLNGNPVTEAAVEDTGSFLSDLVDSMVTPIDDESAASSVVPFVVTGAGDLGAQFKHITFERKSDEWLTGRADRALDRILQGIDVPKEIVTGLANIKYSNAIQIDEDLYKTNIEPLALMFVDALTDIYLRPMLRAQGITQEDVNRVCVWYDPAEIVTRPNQSDEATQGYDRFLLSAEAWRKTHGFTEVDAPDEQELAVQLLFAKGQLPEDVTQSLLRVAFPKVMGEQREKNLADREVPFPDSASELLNPVDTEGAQPENEADTESNNAAAPEGEQQA